MCSRIRFRGSNGFFGIGGFGASGLAGKVVEGNSVFFVLLAIFMILFELIPTSILLYSHSLKIQ